ncbi:hypothetical protein ACIRVF_31745 [Kitasatospora sp. NPDC101157]|uniref:hypothetical protein n=1 Tax=Kitasatospora sp. NPDC101157 TaxID=3364098 RepID=UPI003814DC0B
MSRASTRTTAAAVIAVCIAMASAGCSSSNLSSLSNGDRKICGEAAQGDITALAADRPLADNADIKKNAERITTPPDVIARINNDALQAIVAECAKAGWKDDATQ